MSDKIKSVERSLELLDVLAKHPNGLGVTELANKLDVAKSTVHRMLTTLQEKQFVNQNPNNEYYTLGTHILYLSNFVLENFNIRDLARNRIEELSETTGEAIHLCILDEHEIVYIDKVESNQTIRMHSRIGKRAPVHSTGVGKAMLSHLSKAHVEDILARTEMIAFTQNTITTASDMMDELVKIKEQGYSIDNIENEEGIRCVAAPVLNYNAEPIAAISVSGPVSRITVDRVHNELSKLVLEASNDISKKLGAF
ncbi:IclR family transcriptional regulator [Alkalibacillus haloalkaliphilus]|uniref:IclR family transcriptional regulator n=1 Tax=Alkalibacillus haloalkaliphilus TaxID=94136 RepID=UPI000318F49F|nr:IclR family transcriptional regulator [Alkalibacillus haloalkaliphilus]